MKKIILSLVLFAMTVVGANATVHIIQSDNFFYSPDMLTVDAGDTIRFQWVVGNHPTSSTTGPWGAGIAFPQNSSNPTYDLVLTTPGFYNYICDFHVGLGMVGTIIVNAVPCSGPPASLISFATGSTMELLWDYVPGSIGCEVNGGPAGAGFPFAQRVINSFPDSYGIPLAILAPGSYEVRVRCVCSVDPLVITGYSPTTTFTITAPRLQDGLAEMEASLSPNPAVANAVVQFNAASAGKVRLEMLDMLGGVVQQDEFIATEGSQTYNLDLSDLAYGQYFVRIQMDGAAQILPVSVAK